jgi:tetratricopeptide (TPR) repeat protein
VSGALIRQEQVAVAASHPVDPQVYELCMMGRYHWNKRTPAGLTKAMEYFQEAIRRDPGYAPAHAGLADAYLIMPSYNSVDVDGSLAMAAAEARTALKLDDTLAEAHATLGMVALKNWASESAQAEHEFRRALELNPNYATAHHWFSFYMLFSDRLDEALAELELARQLDPLSAIINADEGHLLYGMGRYTEAKARLRQAIELAPDLGQPHETLALINLAEGRNSDALNEARTGLSLDSKNPRTIGEAGYVLATTGHPDEAQKLLVALNDLVRRGSAFPLFPAFIHIGLGERSQAMDILEEIASSTKGAGLVGLSQWGTIFSQLNAEPRYQKLIAAARY